MKPDDEAARKARADQLRKEIDKLTGAAEPTEAPTPAAEGTTADAPAQPLSPRDFIHKRMRELEDKERDD